MIKISCLVPKKNLDERKEKITIKHLLTMASGLDCNDWDKKSKGQEDKLAFAIMKDVFLPIFHNEE